MRACPQVLTSSRPVKTCTTIYISDYLLARASHASTQQAIQRGR